MHKIDSSGTSSTLPTPAAVGSLIGYFTEAVPGLGIPPTVVSADWLNAIQEEIVGVIEGAGLTLNKNSQSQLKTAIGILAGAGTVTVSKTFSDSPITQARANKQTRVSTAGGNVIINLPAAATCDGERFTFIKTTSDVNTVTIDGNGSEQINGELTQEIDQQWTALSILSIGTGWVIV